jgi:hypothetical protein
MLRQARSLFSRRNVLEKLNLELPTPLPFDGVGVEKRTDTKFYGCGVDPRALLRDAAAELGPDRPEEFKAFLLALVLGLRRREVDMLEWQSFDFAGSTIRIQPTKWYKLKTDESSAVLPIEPEISALFRGWRAKTTAEFVIESPRPAKSVSYQWYRCQETFDALLGWLRAKGVQGQKPFHALRKLLGSAVAELHGIHVARASLRHADISTTTQCYSDRTVKLTSGFGAKMHRSQKIKNWDIGSKPRPNEAIKDHIRNQCGRYPNHRGQKDFDRARDEIRINRVAGFNFD